MSRGHFCRFVPAAYFYFAQCVSVIHQMPILNNLFGMRFFRPLNCLVHSFLAAPHIVFSLFPQVCPLPEMGDVHVVTLTE